MDYLREMFDTVGVGVEFSSSLDNMLVGDASDG
jgi:hypothetical protein